MRGECERIPLPAAAIWCKLTDVNRILFPVLVATVLPNFLACSKKEPVAVVAEASAPAEMAMPSLPDDARWEAAAGLVRHLEFGGTSFSYESHASSNAMIGFLLEMADELIAADAPPNERIQLSRAWKKLGWDRVVGSGSSCRKLGKLWHHRGILFAPKDKPSFFPVFGSEAKPWLAPATAPEDSDLVLEFSMDVPYAMDLIGELARALGPKAAKEWDAQVEQMKSDPIGGGMLDAFKGRLAIFVRLDPKQPIDLPEQLGKFPGVHGGLIFSSPEFAAFGAKMVKEEGAPPFEERADGSLIRITEPSGEDDPSMPKPFWNPTVVLNVKEGFVLMADSPETLAAMEGKESKLSESKEFALAAKNLPTDGNAMVFVSSRLQKELGELAIRYGRELAKGPDVESAKVANFVQDLVAKAFLGQAEPQMAVLKAEADGWAWGANFGFEQLPLEGAAFPVAVLSSVGFSAFEKARETAQLTQALSRGKILYLAAAAYASDHNDRFPASINDLVPAYLTDVNSVAGKLPGVPPDQHWIFLTEGRTAVSNGNLPLFVLNGEINGRQVVITVSGAVQALPPDEVRALIEAQR